MMFMSLLIEKTMDIRFIETNKDYWWEINKIYVIRMEEL